MTDHYQGFVFPPAPLGEDIDLDLELRKQILFAEAMLVSRTHWQVLGVPWNAPADEVRSAYLENVKVFHPDRYPGRRLGSFRPRIERIFRALTEARDVLTDPERRAAYVRDTAPPQERARIEARRVEDERRAQERRARLARTNPVVARAARLAELVARGRQALADGHFAQAANDLVVAATMDPSNAAVQALAAQAKRKAGSHRAAERYEAGLQALLAGSNAKALAAFRAALNADPKHARAALQGAKAALALGDAAAARQLAETAVRAAPRLGAAHEALGLVLAASGAQKDAKLVLEKAIELDPSLEAARQRLKKLRWGGLLG